MDKYLLVIHLLLLVLLFSCRTFPQHQKERLIGKKSKFLTVLDSTNRQRPILAVKANSLDSLGIKSLSIHGFELPTNFYEGKIKMKIFEPSKNRNRALRMYKEDSFFWLNIYTGKDTESLYKSALDTARLLSAKPLNKYRGNNGVAFLYLQKDELNAIIRDTDNFDGTAKYDIFFPNMYCRVSNILDDRDAEYKYEVFTSFVEHEPVQGLFFSENGDVFSINEKYLVEPSDFHGMNKFQE